MKNIRRTVCCTLALFLLCGASTSYAVSDNFNDLDDTNNPTWTRLSGYVASGGQSWSAATGQYHMTAPNSGVANLGFVGSFTGAVQTDVTVQSTIVSFVDLGMPPSGPIEGGPFGVAARLNGDNTPGGLTGYAYIYEPFADGGNGEMILAQIGPGVNVGDLGQTGAVENVDYIRKVTLDLNKDYIFTMRIVGNLLSGEVREVGGPIVAYHSAIDPESDFASGYSGLVAYSQGPTLDNPRGFPPTDVTWDNFSSTSIPEPSSLLLIACGFGFFWFKQRCR
jgi:hypothetical protein